MKKSTGNRKSGFLSATGHLQQPGYLFRIDLAGYFHKVGDLLWGQRGGYILLGRELFRAELPGNFQQGIHLDWTEFTSFEIGSNVHRLLSSLQLWLCSKIITDWYPFSE